MRRLLDWPVLVSWILVLFALCVFWFGLFTAFKALLDWLGP